MTLTANALKRQFNILCFFPQAVALFTTNCAVAAEWPSKFNETAGSKGISCFMSRQTSDKQLCLVSGAVVDATYRMYVITPTLLDRNKERKTKKKEIFLTCAN